MIKLRKNILWKIIKHFCLGTKIFYRNIYQSTKLEWNGIKCDIITKCSTILKTITCINNLKLPLIKIGLYQSHTLNLIFFISNQTNLVRFKFSFFACDIRLNLKHVRDLSRRRRATRIWRSRHPSTRVPRLKNPPECDDNIVEVADIESFQGQSDQIFQFSKDNRDNSANRGTYIFVFEFSEISLSVCFIFHINSVNGFSIKFWTTAEWINTFLGKFRNS